MIADGQTPYHTVIINPYGAENGIFWEKQVYLLYKINRSLACIRKDLNWLCHRIVEV